MNIIELDGSDWKTRLDFVFALQAAIGAPKGHGSSGNAFVDSMIWGGMNSIQPPYEVRVVNSERAPEEVRLYVTAIASAIAEGRKWKLDHRGKDTEVSLRIVSRNSD
jgi:hypothetical protein